MGDTTSGSSFFASQVFPREFFKKSRGPGSYFRNACNETIPRSLCGVQAFFRPVFIYNRLLNIIIYIYIYIIIIIVIECKCIYYIC